MNQSKLKHMLHIGLLFAAIIVIIFALSQGNSENKNKITAKATSMVLAINLENGDCSVKLNKEWNLVSFFCLYADMRPQAYLNDTNSIISIHEYDAFAEKNNWHAYNPSLPDWVIQDLKIIDHTKGYWIRVNNSQTIYFTNGTISKPTMILLKKGWNLLSYPTDASRKIPYSLTLHMGSDWSTVYMYNSSDTIDPWKVYHRTAPLNATNDLQYFSQGFGYWILADKTGDWYIRE